MPLGNKNEVDLRWKVIGERGNSGVGALLFNLVVHGWICMKFSCAANSKNYELGDEAFRKLGANWQTKRGGQVGGKGTFVAFNLSKFFKNATKLSIVVYLGLL